MNYILYSLGALLLFLTCMELPENPLKKKDKRNAIEKYLENGGISLCLSIRSEEKKDEVLDDIDGTISLRTNTYSKYDACPWEWGKPAQKTGIGILKFWVSKCIQGQVYRKEQNDCKGAGSAANYWNAQKYQLCTTNVSTCGNLSPVRLACNSNSTSSIFYFMSIFQEMRNLFKSRPDEIPSGTGDYYWDYGTNAAYNLDGQIANPIPKYDAFYYALCF